MSKINFDEVDFGTLAIHGGQGPDKAYGSIATPIYQTATFAVENVEDVIGICRKGQPGFCYTRAGNPTTRALEEKIALLEGGELCVAAASGMGAIGGMFLGLLSQGDHVVADGCVYGGTAGVLRDYLPKYGIKVTFTDTSDLAAVEAAITEDTKMIYFETPANPTLKITDIKAISELAHAKGIKVVVDDTFAPPPVQFPLKLGADIVVDSNTKYINGHGDALGGSVTGRAEDVVPVRRAIARMGGATPSPFNAFQILRGLQTMELRMEDIARMHWKLLNSWKITHILKKYTIQG